MGQRDDGTPGREWNTHGCLGGITQNSSMRTTTDANANTTTHHEQSTTEHNHHARTTPRNNLLCFTVCATRRHPNSTTLDGVGVQRYLVATSTTSKHTCTMQRTTRYEDKNSTTTASSSDSIFKGITPQYETHTCHCKKNGLLLNNRRSELSGTNKTLDDSTRTTSQPCDTRTTWRDTH